MTWVMLSLRKAALRSRMSDLDARLLQISQKIQDLQHYASSIADGAISPMAMAGCPSSVFNTQMTYMGNSVPMAYRSAQIKTDMFLQQYGAINQQTNGQYQFTVDPTGAQAGYMKPYLIFNEIFKQELKEYSKQIAQKVNAEEKQLESEKLRLEAQLKAISAEYEEVNKKEGENIKNGAIQLA